MDWALGVGVTPSGLGVGVVTGLGSFLVVVSVFEVLGPGFGVVIGSVVVGGVVMGVSGVVVVVVSGGGVVVVVSFVVVVDVVSGSVGEVVVSVTAGVVVSTGSRIPRFSASPSDHLRSE